MDSPLFPHSLGTKVLFMFSFLVERFRLWGTAVISWNTSSLWGFFHTYPFCWRCCRDDFFRVLWVIELSNFIELNFSELYIAELLVNSYWSTWSRTSEGKKGFWCTAEQQQHCRLESIGALSTFDILAFKSSQDCESNNVTSSQAALPIGSFLLP